MQTTCLSYFMSAVSQNYFELFDLPKQFVVDPVKLRKRYLSLQREYHPDRLAQTQRAADQTLPTAALINDAYRVLNDPIARAEYLLSADNVDAATTSIAPDFLMQQMELRERVDQARSSLKPADELKTLRAEVEQHQQRRLQALEQQFIVNNKPQAQNTLQELQFLQKLTSEIEQLLLAIQTEDI